MAVVPTITLPTSQPGFSTNSEYLTLGGTADPSTKSILVNGSSGSVLYTPGATGWSYSTTLTLGDNLFQVMAADFSNVLSGIDTIDVTYTPNSNLNLIISAPTGITLARGKNTVQISVVQNPEISVIGYNFYASQDPGGGTEGYTLLNSTLVTIANTYVDNNVVLSNTTTTSGNTQTTVTIEQVNQIYYFAYTHDRTVQPIGPNPITALNYYVVTAVAYDPTLQQEVESTYSAELGAAPILINTTITDLPLRATVDVQQSYINEVLTNQPTISINPGTITRDVHINPPSDEFERLYVIQDFSHRSQSFLTLLAFDDPNNTGSSAPILTTPNKLRLMTALLVTPDNSSQVQQIIDDAFTKLAGNVNVARKGAQDSIGQVLFYTTKKPTKDASISAGAIVQTLSDATTPAVQFSVTTNFTLPVASLSQYFNQVTNRYEVILDIVAVLAGSAGDVAAGKITTVVSGIDSIFGVTNPNPTQFGQNLESNNSLAQRALLAFVSVDSGTAAGYLATTLGTPDVTRTVIITAGDSYMQRDIDPLRLIHTFGCIDIYILGNILTDYTDNFGFTFATVYNAPVLIVSANSFIFQVFNPAINANQPIYDLIQVTNVTQGVSYDTTGFTVLGNGDTFELNPTLVTNAATPVKPTDVVTASYRYRASQPYIFKNQPCNAIVSVVGEISGPLTSDNYVLQKLQDPLQFGNSTQAQDQLAIVYANGLPTGQVVPVIAELQTLFGENPNDLVRYGIDPTTIVVTSQDASITYVESIDYLIIPGSMSTLTQIERTVHSNIPNGATVAVSYTAGENFAVTYAVNALLYTVLARVNLMRHLTADVVIKSALLTYINFDIDVVLSYGADQTSVDTQIRTNIANIFVQKLIGSSIYQSDVVKAIENTDGVDHILLPFNTMVRADGSSIQRELYSGTWAAYQTINVTSYKSVGTLSWSTTVGGGPNNSFQGVFQNDILLTMVSTIQAVAETAGSSYIDGSGYLYVSLLPAVGTNISTSTITVTYTVQGATGYRDISFSEIEYGAVGTLSLTYSFAPQVKGY